MSDEPVKTRSYDNSHRATQARQTRGRVVSAAHELLLERGYAATTLVEVATRAGVSVDTVFKGFGSKAALTKQVYDVALAGDDEPIPMGERPEFLAIASAPDAGEKISRYAALARRIATRLGPLLHVLLGSQGVDADLGEFVRTIEHERLLGSESFVRHLEDSGSLRADLDMDRARDILWAINSPEVYLLLVVKQRWPIEQYERWLTGTLSTALLPPDR